MNTYKEIYDQSVKEKSLKPLDTTYVKWAKKGDVILGRFKGSSAVESQQGGGEYNQYLFETDEGLVKFSLGRAADAEIGAVMQKDMIYRIEFLGQEPLTGGRKVNKFKCDEIGFGDEVISTDKGEK